MTSLRLTVLAIGNRSRGDDALGPLLLDWFQLQWPDCAAFEVFQLQPEHALDLCNTDRVLFMDAAFGQASAVRLFETDADSLLRPESAGRSHEVPVFTHAMSPDALLRVFAQTQQRPPPPAFVLSMRCHSSALGAPLSDAAQLALSNARALLLDLMGNTDLQHWRGLAST